jgi:hypothetical protein
MMHLTVMIQMARWLPQELKNVGIHNKPRFVMAFILSVNIALSSGIYDSRISPDAVQSIAYEN